METVVLHGSMATALKCKLTSRLELGLWALKLQQIVVSFQKPDPSQVICDIRCNLVEEYIGSDEHFSKGQLAIFPLPNSAKSQSLVPLPDLPWREISRQSKTLVVTFCNFETGEPIITTDYEASIHLSVKRIK